MKQNENMHTKKIIVNDLLCFVQNNIRGLTELTICSLCEETYMPDEIKKAFQDLEDNVKLLDPTFKVKNNNSNIQALLQGITHMFESKACCSLQFVSSNCNMPRMSAYRDMLSISCMLNEMKELKQLVKDQGEILTAGFCRLSNQFENFKLTQEEKNRAEFTKGEESLPSIPQETLSDILNLPNMEKKNSISETDALELPFDNANDEKELEMIPDEDIAICEKPSQSLVLHPSRQMKVAHAKKDQLSSSLKALSSTGKYYKNHSCKVCGYTGSLTDVTRHMRTHTGERPFSCPLCSTKFTLRGNMIKHLSRKHGTFLSRLPSSTKGVRHSTKKNKDSHKRRATGKSRSIASNANMPKPSENTLNEEDVESNLSDIEFQAHLSDPVTELSEIKLENINANFSSFALDMDNKDSEALLDSIDFSRSSLIGEMTQASSAVATYNPMLHLQSSHPDDMPLVSSLPNIDLYVSNQLNKKRHRCDICGYTGNASDVTRHKRTHTGERPYPCPVCDARFSLRGNMTKHLVRMHPEHEAK